MVRYVLRKPSHGSLRSLAVCLQPPLSSFRDTSRRINATSAERVPKSDLRAVAGTVGYEVGFFSLRTARALVPSVTRR